MLQDAYWSQPHGNYESRRQAFLEYAAAAPAGSGRTGFFSQLCRLALVQPDIDTASIIEGIEYVNARHDCADFTVSGLLRLLYLYRDQLDPALVDTIESSLVNFKYWIDEPGYNDMMCFWTENHQIMFHSDEYLAGQMFRHSVFPNVNQNGQWHMDRARAKILAWIDLRARLGFSEWDSNCYYDEDMTPVLNLADFAEDEEIATRAAMILDVMFFDMAVDSFRGVYGTSHGRSYPKHVLSGLQEATAGVQKIAWGMGVFNDPANMTAVSLATSPRYRVPPVIEALAQAMPESFENRERHSLGIDDTEFDTLDTAMRLWGAGQFANQRNVAATLRIGDEIQSHRFDVVIRPYVEAVEQTYAELDRQGIPHDGDINRTTMSPVNKYTYRTPDYQLSSAQDYRKGKPGFQQHIWQATLGPEAIVFALHRGNEDEESYKYWVGRFPRVGQHQNVLVALFDIPEEPVPGPKTQFPPEAGGNDMPSPAPSEEMLLPYTVAVLRCSAFDEVIERDQWVFARKGSGYLALYSDQPTRWTADGVLQGEGLIAGGRRNVWICHLGRESVDGAFAQWVDRIASADCRVDGLSVDYVAPGVGQIQFDWHGPLRVNGEPQSLGDYARFDNPYCHSVYGSGVYPIQYDGRALELDFTAGIRRFEGNDPT